MNQLTDTLMVVRPAAFRFNEQTAASNSFQKTSNLAASEINARALAEFDTLVSLLKKNSLNVVVVNDDYKADTPDSIFPNNWFSTHADGRMVIYPMMAENRRRERRPEILSMIKKEFIVTDSCDLTSWELDGKFLEGTGSLVLDRPNRIAYAALSGRTNTEVLNSFSKSLGYKIVHFKTHRFGSPVYHTNVMLSLGEKWTAVCSDLIFDEVEKKCVLENLQQSKREIIFLSIEQVNEFAGNMLEVKNHNGDNLVLMSTRAFSSLAKTQITALEEFATIIHTPLDTIETHGGGSARCMLAEIFLQRKN